MKNLIYIFTQVEGTKFIFNPLEENKLPRSRKRWADEPGAPSVGRQGFYINQAHCGSMEPTGHSTSHLDEDAGQRALNI